MTVSIGDTMGCCVFVGRALVEVNGGWRFG